MDYNMLVRKARSRNIRITKKTRNGRKYLTASELRKKLKRRKLLRKKLSIKKTGFFNGLMGGLLGRSSRKAKKLRKARKLRKLRKLRKNKKRRAKSGKRSAIGGGALYALKTVATGAAIQLGAEAAKRALAM